MMMTSNDSNMRNVLQTSLGCWQLAVHQWPTTIRAKLMCSFKYPTQTDILIHCTVGHFDKRNCFDQIL